MQRKKHLHPVRSNRKTNAGTHPAILSNARNEGAVKTGKNDASENTNSS